MLMAWASILALLFLLPLVLGITLPEMKLIIAVILVLSIYSCLRQFFGDGWITLILTAAAAYYLVYKHFWITTTLWWINIILGTAAFSAVGWTFIVFTKFMQRKRV